MKCSDCSHWFKIPVSLDRRGNAVQSPKEEDQAGECRSQSPRPVSSVGGGFRAFPITRAVDGCGEFLQKKEEISEVRVEKKEKIKKIQRLPVDKQPL